MPEALTITHTIGTPGWSIVRRGGARAWALSAMVGTLLGRRLGSNLALLWRLRSLWRSGLAGLDARSARLALCLDRRITLAGLAAELRFGDAHFALNFVRAANGSDGLPAPFDGGRWLVAAVAAGSRPAFARLAAALPGVQRGAAITIALSAAQSDAPPAAREGFGARLELRIGAQPDWITLLSAQRITAAIAPASRKRAPPRKAGSAARGAAQPTRSAAAKAAATRSRGR